MVELQDRRYCREADCQRRRVPTRAIGGATVLPLPRVPAAVRVIAAPPQRTPAEADEYYHADLIGLEAVTADGAGLGTVIAVHNYGAGDLLEIAPKRGETILVPFTRAVVPEVDLAARRLIIEPPEGLLNEP